MKSQPDAAPRLAAEVVTQLPVPSRLGMLRFERLNEASWAMLYLDPHCERQFGMPAADLCALVGSPYASLMEPRARYHLHDAIEHQLRTSHHYVVHYTLHTALGPLNLMELGEAYARKVGYPIQYQWTLLKGINDGQDELDEILRLFKGKYAVLNLIPFNSLEGDDYQRPDGERIVQIVRYLHSRGVLTKVRNSAGQDVEGGCGQLRARAVDIVNTSRLHD